MAACHELRGRLAAAEDALSGAEALVAGCEDEALAGRVLLAAARVSWLRGETEAAAQRYRAALAIWDRLGNVTRGAQVLIGLGLCALQRGERGAARDLFRQAAGRSAAANWARAAAAGPAAPRTVFDLRTQRVLGARNRLRQGDGRDAALPPGPRRP